MSFRQNLINKGGYSGVPNYYITVLDGIKQKVGDKVNVQYAEGCRITIGGSWVEDKITFPAPEEEKVKIAEAVEVAKNADVVVLVLGGNEQTSREAWNIYHLGDRASLQLVGMQDELIDALKETGKPIVAFVYNGRPLAFNNLIEKADAIFECWYPGQESGHAVADILFGDYNPGAKLPISFPRSVGHTPVYYNHKPSARRGYFNADVTPLYPFGYGLSYTTFEFSNLRLAKETIAKDEAVKVLVDVSNIGKMKGDEVVQMYIRDELSTLTRPVKELKDFARVTLEPGETKTVEIEILPEKLKFWDINMEYVVEPGEFTVMVGNSSADEGEENLRKWAQWSHQQNKPFLLTEYGNMNLGWGADHPNQKSLEASLSNASDVMRGLRAGVDGFNRWSYTNRGNLDAQWQPVQTYDRKNKTYFLLHHNEKGISVN